MARGVKGRHQKFIIEAKKYTRTPLYLVWCCMRNRCFNPNTKNFNRYGGRGISISEEWSEFDPFADWALVNGWAEGLTLDRIDNDGNYCPENCRFVTLSENASKTTQTERKSASDRINAAKARESLPKRPVRCVGTGEVFESLRAAERHLGVYKDTIHKAIKRGIRCRGNYWEYATESPHPKTRT